MQCKSELLPVAFPHHVWRTEVTSTHYLKDQATNMWGRTVYGEHVICHKHEVCERCGEVRSERDCICDLSVGEQCAIRLECLREGTKVNA